MKAMLVLRTSRARKFGRDGLASLTVVALCLGLVGHGAWAQQVRELPRAPDWPGLETDDSQAAGSDESGSADADDASALQVGRLETQLEFDRLAEEGNFPQALELADTLIERTEAEFGTDSLQSAEVYQDVAGVQRRAEQYERAEENYLHAVALIRDLEGTFSEQAIPPLVGLGDTYHDSGQYLNAVTAYDEARTVNRRVYGLLNEGQIPILDRITASLQELDQYQEADEQQLTILHMAERSYEVGSPEYLEAIYRYAGWLRRSGRYHEERAQYSRAQRVIRDLFGKESPLLAKPLRETANSFRAQRIPDSQGINALEDALELVESAAEPNPLQTAEVLRDLGDWEVAFSKGDPDIAVYRRAWGLLADVDDGDTLRQEWFSRLDNVLGEPISQRGLSRDPDALRGFVVVQFAVDRYGRTEDVQVARSDPPGLKDDAVTRAVERWRFRPFIEDGEIIEKDRLALQFNYRYLPDEGV